MASINEGHVVASDGTRLFYRELGEGRPLVLVHGWSFSGRFFDEVLPDLAAHARVIVPDLRGHGRSDKPAHGHRVARLAADLRDLLAALDLKDATLLGWSIGCAVLWSHHELFGQARVRGLILAQQSPRQFLSADWTLGHGECFDAASLATAMTKMAADPAASDRANLAACTRRPIPEQRRRLWLEEMALAPAASRAALMADHAQADWRDLLPAIEVPSLVLAAQADPIFAAEAVAWVGKHIPQARTVLFENSSHMLFHDEPDRFVGEVTRFLHDEHRQRRR